MLKKMNKTLTHIAVTGLLYFSVVISANADYAATDWDQLNQEQQAVLKNLEDSWENIPDERRQRLITGASRWNEMTPGQREQAKNRLQQWKNASPEEKAKMRQRMKEFHDLPLELKQAMRKKYQWFNDLPEEEREKLRNRWENLAAEKKQEVLDRLRSNPAMQQTPAGLQNSLQNNTVQQQSGGR
jgi:hypothetical protein